MSPSHHIIRNFLKNIKKLKNKNKKWLTHLDVEVMEVASTKGDSQKILQSLPDI
jgi:hypothetical protein